MDKKKIAIIGGGSSGLFCACFLDPTLYDISIYEATKRVGAKFLVAGKGGFNLTHSEPIQSMKSRYSQWSPLLHALDLFDNQSMIQWLKDIGISTFVGSSRRVFPSQGIKPIEVLNAIKNILDEKEVQVFTNHKWTGWNENNLVFNHRGEPFSVNSDITILALGGASWPQTGSDGSWVKILEDKGIHCSPFLPANVGLHINWSATFKAACTGKPLKNIALEYEGETILGELVITERGIEGSPAYAFANAIARSLENEKSITVNLDLKPTTASETIKKIFIANERLNNSEILKKKLKLSSPARMLIKSFTSKEEFNDLGYLTKVIKQMPLPIRGVGKIQEAISTSGGVMQSSLEEDFSLISKPQLYCVGEMIDWTCPTGGYLLQACYSMARQVAKLINDNRPPA